MNAKHLRLIDYKSEQEPIYMGEFINEVNSFITSKLQDHRRISSFNHQVYYIVAALLVVSKFSHGALEMERQYHSANPMPEDLRIALQEVAKYADFGINNKDFT